MLAIVALFGVGGCEQHITDVLFARDFGIELGPVDLIGPATPSLCSTANALLCDGFEEEGITPNKPWDPVVYNAGTSLDSTHVYRGAKALLVTTDPMADKTGRRQGELTETSVSPNDGPVADFYSRFFFYLPSPAPTAQFRIFGVLQENGGDLGPQLSIQPGKILMQLQNSATANMQMPTDQWVCIELEVLTSSTAGKVRLSINGTDITALDMNGDTTMPNGYGRVSIGAAAFGQSETLPQLKFWYDEVILDNKPIGCDR